MRYPFVISKRHGPRSTIGGLAPSHASRQRKRSRKQNKSIIMELLGCDVSRACAPSPSRSIVLIEIKRLALVQSVIEHATRNDETFEFLKLPAELRNLVYDFSSVELTKSPLAPGLRSSVRSLPSTNILLVCQQIYAEYKHRTEVFLKLTIKDHADYNFGPITFPERLLQLRSLELHLLLFCHHCSDCTYECNDDTSMASQEADRHEAWIRTLLPTLKCLKSLSIRAYLCFDGYTAGRKEAIPCEKLVKQKITELLPIPALTELSVYKYDYQSDSSLEGPKTMIMDVDLRSSMGRSEMS